MDERKQAISLANSYFALVDGLASSLEHHLAEDVVLDWFGRTIRGRRNVTAFMEAHKVNSRHMFSDIVPTDGIGYKKKGLNRKTLDSYRSQIGQESLKKYIDNEANRVTSEVPFPETAMPMLDINQNEIDAKDMNVMDDMSYDLCEGDLGNLFKLEIAPTNIEEIERSINRIKLEEEMAPTVETIKTESGEGDGPVTVQTSTVKYVEANGEIEFSRKIWKRDNWNAYFSATSNVHTWRRPCKLQLAYSTLTEHPTSEPPRRKKNVNARSGQPKARLPSLEEIREIGNRLIPNPSNFGGFLEDIDFFEDREGFLELLGMEIATKDPCTPLIVPEYVENKLVFSKPRVNTDDRDNGNRKKFIFHYQIHVIIYEGSNKCKMNLSREFEKANIKTKIAQS